MSEEHIYQLKVTLADTHPPVWRRIQTPGGVTLDELHEILQTAMGWSDSHLHMFLVEGRRYGEPDPDSSEEVLDERDAHLQDLAETGTRLLYEYDFGDGWLHELEVEAVMEPEGDAAYPQCTAGERACPPEDCGGAPGYEHLLEVLGNPDDEEHEEMLEWVGGEFDPEAFDPDEVNEELRWV